MMDKSTAIPRWRKITFYVIAALVLAMILGLLWPLLAFAVLAWLPLEAWEAVFPNETIDSSLVSYRIHELSFSLVFWSLAIGVGLQLWKPAKRQAPMLQALAVITAFIVIDLLSGSFDAEAVPIMAGVVLLTLLHPARERLFRFNRPNRAMSSLALLAAIPGAFFMEQHISVQRLNVLGDQHAEFGHWSAMAVLAMLIVLWGLIGSTDQTGWRVTASITGISAVAYGLASMVFPDVASPLATGWAIAAIVWGVAYLFFTFRRPANGSHEPTKTSARSATHAGASTLLLLVVAGLVTACGTGNAVVRESGASNSITIGMTEFAFLDDTVSLAADQDVSVTLENLGTVEHEWVILKPGINISDESRVLFRMPVVGVGESANGSFNLEANTYQIVCAITGHFTAGMQGTLKAVSG